MTTIIDLSGPITTGMWNYGGPLTEIEVAQTAFLEKDGYQAHQMLLHSLAGTYLETANHLFADRKTLDQVPIERFISRAWVAQLPEKESLEQITVDEMEAAIGDRIQPGDSLLVATGWDRMWNKPGFADACPYFTNELMEWIVAKEVGLLGVDIPSVENPQAGTGFQLPHYYEQDRLLLAPLVNLRKAHTGPYTLITMPIHVPGVCAVPCRAVLVDKLP